MESYSSYQFLLLVAITAANAFFASAEAALLSSNQARLRALASEGHVGAHAALSLLGNTERMLSVVQVGVTLASVGLGWVGEETVYRFLVALLDPIATPGARALLHAASFVLAFLVLTFTLVVVGEVVPKSLAIEKADRFAVLASPPLLVFYRLSLPFVYVVERSAKAISHLLGLRRDPRAGGHSAEELLYLVTASRMEGRLHCFEENAIRRVLELQDYSAREIMVPRGAILSLPVSADLDRLLRLVTDHQYSRIPIYEAKPENIIGVVHVKDLLGVWEERRLANQRRRPVPPFDLRRLLRKPLVAPETKPLSQLLDDFRATHAHMALVVDEFGTIAGLVTLEDVLEQVVGEIEDEYDLRRPAPSLEAPEVELEGSVNIRDLATQYGIDLPGDAGFETLAGFLLFQLGYIPQEGETVEHGGRRFTILAMDRNRIARVRIERIAA